MGEKTLNLEHIFLKEMKIDKHIDRLAKDVKDLKNGEIDTSNYDKLEEAK